MVCLHVSNFFRNKIALLRYRLKTVLVFNPVLVLLCKTVPEVETIFGARFIRANMELTK